MNLGSTGVIAENQIPEATADSTITQSSILDPTEYSKGNPYLDSSLGAPDSEDHIDFSEGTYAPEGTKPNTTRQVRNASGTWIQSNGKWWFQYSSGGYPASTWEQINNKWYYFDANGWMVTGWLLQGTTWYYLDPAQGHMITGWYKINGVQYLFNSVNGAMVTGWANIGNSYYYFDSNGAMIHDTFRTINGSTYYFHSNGVMAVGYFVLGKIPDTKEYYANSQGEVYINRWLISDYQLTYYGSDGIKGEVVKKCSTGNYDYNCHKYSSNISPIKYYITNLSTVEKNYAVNGMNQWHGLSNISFTESRISSATLLIHYDSEILDNRTGAYTSHTDVELEEIENMLADWSKAIIGVNNLLNPVNKGALYYEHMIQHETGHALGLRHSAITSNIMYNIDTYFKDPSIGYTSVEQSTLRHLYE